MRGLRVLLLGRPRLEVDGQPLAADLPSKYQLLLYFLAAEGVAVGRAELASLLWEDRDVAVARGNLRTALTRLRRTLPGVLAIDSRHVSFDPTISVQVDWAILARAAQGEGSHGERAAAALLWRGPLLEGFELDGEAVERWLSTARARALHQVVRLRRSLAAEAASVGRQEDAEMHWRALLDVDDADEGAHVALMELLAATGRRAAAIAQYEACRGALADRFGARPSADTYALYARIHAQTPTTTSLTPVQTAPGTGVGWVGSRNRSEIAEAPSTSSTAAGIEPRHLQSQMPEPEGPLIGREIELALLTERLADADCRWISIVGPGGVGKTRLALAAATTLAPRWRHGMLWISGRDTAGPLRDAETLAQCVIERTGADRMNPGALLLVLDNLETVAEPALMARDLRARAPGLCVLATSRRRLGVPREWLLELAGLSIARRHPDARASSPAAALLTAAVKRLDPRFDPSREAESIEALCEHVGGLPLALELAARGVLDTGLPSVLKRLQCGAPLEDRGRDGRTCQPSTDIVMCEAWMQLSADAQTAALRLAWLPGSFDLSLANAMGAALAKVEVLREQSWLRLSSDGLLAFHPLQQDFLRRQDQPAALRIDVHRALAAHVRNALPELPSFAAWPAGRTLPTNDPWFNPSMLAQALEHLRDHAEPDAFASWVDSVSAALLAADRQVEAASMLEIAWRCTRMPAWRRTGWRLLQAQALNSLGDIVASMQGYEAAMSDLGLDGALRDGSSWGHLPFAILQSLRRTGWPVATADRYAFQGLICRSLDMYTQQLSFTPGMDRAIRANVLASVMMLRASKAELQATWVMTAYGMLTTGRTRLAHAMLHSLQHRTPVKGDPLLEAFTREGDCVIRVALGRWNGVAEELHQLHLEMDRLGDHRHAMECHALIAKLRFYQGHLALAAEDFAQSTELALQRPGGSWRAWGLFGQAEVALCRSDSPLPVIERWVALGSHWLTDKQNFDAAYVLRRLGLLARLAWRRGDAELARETVLGAIAVGGRIPHCSFWAHEGFAGIGEVLFLLRAHEKLAGGALRPLDDAWRVLESQLQRHARRFPAGAAMVHRLRGLAAQATGQETIARRCLLRAVTLAEVQGLRVELARSCDALATLDPTEGWAERAGRLWSEMTDGATSV